jgi:hypothetical protein
MADKTPIRGAYNGSSALTGLAEYATGDTVSVPFGGTGATSLTDNAVLIGNSTSAIQPTSALTTNGQIVIGGTSGPAVANISGTTNEVDITNGDGTVTIGLPSALCSTGTLEIGGNVSLDGGTFIFNESGADKDFRIEGDTDANLFIADASTDRIGIGTATPSHLLDVDGVANVATCIITPKICIYPGGFSSGYVLPAADGSAGQLMCTDGSGALAFATASAGVTLAGSTNNTIATVTGANALAGEANLTFDGSTLNVVGNAGVGIARTEGTLHVHTATAGSVTANTAADDLVIEGSASQVGMSFLSTNSAKAFILFGDPDATNSGQISYDHSDNGLRLYTAATERVTIDSAGFVGIGTGSPLRNLEVQRSENSYNHGVLIKNTYTSGVLDRASNLWLSGAMDLNGYTHGSISFQYVDTNIAQIYVQSEGTTAGTGRGSRMSFSTKVDNSGTYERMRIKSTGAVCVGGAFSKGSGSFKIDHPLPEKTDTHHLVHSFIEGPQADLLYRGTATLTNGTATVNIDTAARITDGTFAALVGNVQVYTTNETAFEHIRASVTGNVLTISSEDDTSTASISWLVIGERKDKHMLDTEWTDADGRVITEPEKTEEG